MLAPPRILRIAALALSVSACSEDYTPSKYASGKTIYQQACSRCHTDTPETPDMYWTINLKNANNTYVAYKVNVGSMFMPKFPNINGNSMELLSEFVLDHSLRK